MGDDVPIREPGPRSSSESGSRHLTYSLGSEHNPVDAIGRDVLSVSEDGSACLHNVARRGDHTWTGTFEPDALQRLWNALRLAPPGPVPRRNLVADETLRHLTVEGDAVVARSIVVGDNGARALPGYGEVFRLLDLAITQLSGRGVSPVSAQEVVVTNVTLVAARGSTSQRDHEDEQGIVCPECGQHNRPTRRFCRRCGLLLHAGSMRSHRRWWFRRRRS